ncbi:MAG: hypothetical protein LBC74_06675 [Planctomycetaceae bacterium]|nr:hypothetical protein [Planctomycetaceae bacterium]
MPINTNDKIIGNIDINEVVQKILADLGIKSDAVEIRHENSISNTERVKNTDKVIDVIDKKDVVEGEGKGVSESELVIDGGRVISLEDVRRKLDNVKADSITSVVISPKCILTPSAKDELKKRKLGIVVRKIGKNNFPLWLMLHDRIVVSISLLKHLQSEYDLIRTQIINLSGIVDEALKIAEQKKRGIILTQHPATVLRATGLCEILRVIIAVNPKQVSIDAKEIDANLMIIPPARINESDILESVRSFCQTQKSGD